MMENEKSSGGAELFSLLSAKIDWRRSGFCFGPRHGHGSHFLASRTLDAGGLALQIAQVIQPRTANFTLADDVNRTDRRRVQRENALDANAKTNPAHRKSRA